MQDVLRLSTTVLPGGRIEVSDPQLSSGEVVERIVLPASSRSGAGRSIVEVLREAPGQLLFNTAAEVDAYLRAEREAWER